MEMVAERELGPSRSRRRASERALKAKVSNRRENNEPAERARAVELDLSDDEGRFDDVCADDDEIDEWLSDGASEAGESDGEVWHLQACGLVGDGPELQHASAYQSSRFGGFSGIRLPRPRVPEFVKRLRRKKKDDDIDNVIADLEVSFNALSIVLVAMLPLRPPHVGARGATTGDSHRATAVHVYALWYARQLEEAGKIQELQKRAKALPPTFMQAAAMKTEQFGKPFANETTQKRSSSARGDERRTSRKPLKVVGDSSAVPITSSKLEPVIDAQGREELVISHAGATPVSKADKLHVITTAKVDERLRREVTSDSAGAGIVVRSKAISDSPGECLF